MNTGKINRLAKRRSVRVLAALGLMMILTFAILNAYVNRQLAKASFTAVDDCHKVWSARGSYSNEIEQNSVASIQKAFDLGAVGVEVDVYFDRDLSDFIVSHDEPYVLKDGKILTLEELFAQIDEVHYYWLDFKKLRRLNRKQVQAAVSRLKAISDPYGLQNHIYVEGENPSNLAHFRRAGFRTIFDTHPLADDTWINAIVLAGYKMLFYFGEHSVMSMKYGDLDKPIYGSNTQRSLAGIPVFLYHVPVDETLVSDLLAKDSVRAMLVGRDQSVNLHHMNDCESVPSIRP